MGKILVKDTEINVIRIKEEDYICLTDMLKVKDGDFFITDWLRNRNTLEYIGIIFILFYLFITICIRMVHAMQLRTRRDFL